MTETLVLLPEGEIYSRASVRVIGHEYGLQDLVTIDHQVIVTKTRARTVYSGMGRPRSYAPIRFKVWHVDNVTPFTWDGREQRAVKAHLLVTFNKSA